MGCLEVEGFLDFGGRGEEEMEEGNEEEEGVEGEVWVVVSWSFEDGWRT